jgi:hypothetical protein
MFSAIFSFLGGAAFRFILGKATEMLEKRQEHLQELARIDAQEKIDAGKHERQKDLIKMQADLGIKEIQIAGSVAVEKAAADAFTEAMKNANKPTGVAWVDAWNGCIRPAGATIALLLWLLQMLKAALVLTEWDKNLIASILGYFYADRSIGKTRQ